MQAYRFIRLLIQALQQMTGELFRFEREEGGWVWYQICEFHVIRPRLGSSGVFLWLYSGKLQTIENAARCAYAPSLSQWTLE